MWCMRRPYPKAPGSDGGPCVGHCARGCGVWCVWCVWCVVYVVYVVYAVSLSKSSGLRRRALRCAPCQRARPPAAVSAKARRGDQSHRARFSTLTWTCFPTGGSGCGGLYRNQPYLKVADQHIGPCVAAPAPSSPPPVARFSIILPVCGIIYHYFPCPWRYFPCPWPYFPLFSLPVASFSIIFLAVALFSLPVA